MSRLFHRHHFKPVTRNLAVTPKTAVPQALPPLSPLSPLNSLPLLLRGIEVWGCRLSPVTVVTDEGTPTATALTHPMGRGLGPSCASAADRCHPAVCIETEIQDRPIAATAFDAQHPIGMAVILNSRAIKLRGAWRFLRDSRPGALTAPAQKLPQSHINVLRSSMWPAGGWGFLCLKRQGSVLPHGSARVENIALGD
jgi:hypothetical protein